MYRWRFSFKLWVSSPSFTEAPSIKTWDRLGLVPNQPPANKISSVAREALFTDERSAFLYIHVSLHLFHCPVRRHELYLVHSFWSYLESQFITWRLSPSISLRVRAWCMVPSFVPFYVFAAEGERWDWWRTGYDMAPWCQSAFKI